MIYIEVLREIEFQICYPNLIQKNLVLQLTFEEFFLIYNLLYFEAYSTMYEN
jgi:hypothetical protein